MNDRTHSNPETGIRETYVEYQRDGRAIAEIADPANDDAWITSTLTYPIEA